MGLTPVVLDDFSGGDPGRTRPQGSAPTTFRGVNVWQYPAGIGPRPPFQDVGITGLVSGKLATFGILSVGVLSANLVWAYDATPSPVRWSRRSHGTASASAGSLTYRPFKCISSGANVHWVAFAGAGGSLGVDGTGFDADVSGKPDGIEIATYGEGEVIGRHLVDYHEAILRYSTLQDTATWPVDQTNSIGFGQTIHAIYPHRNTLLILMRDGSIYTITGVLGVNETLRRTANTLPHAALGAATGAVLNGSSLWYCSGPNMVRYNGALPDVVLRPDLPMVSGFDSNPWQANPGHVLPLPGQDEFLLIGTLDKTSDATKKTVWGQAFRGGAWTRHHIPVTEFVNSATSATTAESVKVCPEYVGDLMYITTSSSTTAPQLYVMNPRQEFPHLPIGAPASAAFDPAESWTLNDAASAAPTVGTFASSEVWTPNGAQQTVRTVLVDYSYYPTLTPFSTYSKFNLSVEALQSPGSVAVVRSTAQTFTPPASGDSADGSPMVRGQARFQMGEQGSGVGFRVRLDDWRGILVHRITVMVAVEETLS